MLDELFSRLGLRSLIYGTCFVVAFEIGYCWYFNVGALQFYSVFDYVKGAIGALPMYLAVMSLLAISPSREMKEHFRGEALEQKRKEFLDKLGRGFFGKALFWFVNNLHNVLYFAVGIYLANWYPENIVIVTLSFGFFAAVFAMFMRSTQKLLSGVGPAWRFDIPIVGAGAVTAFLIGSLLADQDYLSIFSAKKTGRFKCGQFETDAGKVIRGLEKGYLVVSRKNDALWFVDKECQAVVGMPIRRKGFVYWTRITPAKIEPQPSVPENKATPSNAPT